MPAFGRRACVRPLVCKSRAKVHSFFKKSIPRAIFFLFLVYLLRNINMFGMRKVFLIVNRVVLAVSLFITMVFAADVTIRVNAFELFGVLIVMFPVFTLFIYFLISGFENGDNKQPPFFLFLVYFALNFGFLAYLTYNVPHEAHGWLFSLITAFTVLVEAWNMHTREPEDDEFYYLDRF